MFPPPPPTQACSMIVNILSKILFSFGFVLRLGKLGYYNAVKKRRWCKRNKYPSGSLKPDKRRRRTFGFLKWDGWSPAAWSANLPCKKKAKPLLIFQRRSTRLTRICFAPWLRHIVGIRIGNPNMRQESSHITETAEEDEEKLWGLR